MAQDTAAPTWDLCPSAETLPLFRPLANATAVADDAPLPTDVGGENVDISQDDTTVLSAIFHVVEHFSGHTYQIILLTKRFTGRDLGFYSYLDKTGRR